MTLPVLYSYWRSSASWRVRIALALKGIAYEYRPVHLIAGGGEQHGEDYRRRNPMRELPTLEIDGALLTQSLPIIEYLDERTPTPPLLPSDPLGRAKARRLAEIVNAGIQPVQNLRVLQYLERELGVDAEAKKTWGAHWIRLGLEGFEPLVAQSAGQYCIGDTVTLPDLCLVPQIYNARRFGVSLDAFPTIERIDAALGSLEAFRVAHPDRQPDAQPG